MDSISEFPAGIWANPLYRKLILSMLVVLGTFLLQIIARQVLVKRLTRLSGETAHTYTLRKIIDYVTLVVGLIILFGIWVQRSADLTVAAGLLAAGLAFALQEVIGSVAGWLSILFGRPFVLGDRIETGKITGDVIDIGVLRTTLMETGNWLGGHHKTGRIVTLSNAFIFKEPLFNYSREIHYVWDEVRLCVPYSADWERARAILFDIVRQHPRYAEMIPQAEQENVTARRAFALNLESLEPRSFVKIAESWIELAVIYPVAYNGRRGFRSEVSETLLRRLAEEGIPVASPALSVEVKQL